MRHAMLSYRAERAQWRQPLWVVTPSTWMSVLNRDPTASWDSLVPAFLQCLITVINTWSCYYRIPFPLIKGSRVVCFSDLTPLTRASFSIHPSPWPSTRLAGEKGSPLAEPPLAVLFNFTVSRGWAWIHYRKPSAHCDHLLKCLN